VSAAVRAARGEKEKLVLGDLGACVDWGYAPDYVDAMVLISELPDADDYIVATGEAHSVREFVEAAFEYVGFDWREHVVERPSVLARRSPTLIGDYRRLNERTGWRPTISFREMVRTLIDKAGTSAS
jgi:GDPmannose 4,6-dehydratase